MPPEVMCVADVTEDQPGCFCGGRGRGTIETTVGLFDRAHANSDSPLGRRFAMSVQLRGFRARGGRLNKVHMRLSLVVLIVVPTPFCLPNAKHTYTVASSRVCALDPTVDHATNGETEELLWYVLARTEGWRLGSCGGAPCAENGSCFDMACHSKCCVTLTFARFLCAGGFIPRMTDLAVPVQANLSTIMTPGYVRCLSLRIEVKYGRRAMVSMVRPISYMGLYQPLPEDDEAGQEMRRHLLEERERTLSQAAEDGDAALAAVRACLVSADGARMPATTESTPLVESGSL